MVTVKNHQVRWQACFVLIPILIVAQGCQCSDAPVRSASSSNQDSSTTQVTFSDDIAPLVFEHCCGCHRPGEAAPFSLLTYEDVAVRAQQIADVTQSRYMPPWLPRADRGTFVAERCLSEEQIEKFRLWAQHGKPLGDDSRIPAVPQFPSGWQLGEPDLVVTMSEPYVLPADATDVFRNFVIRVPLKQRQFVRGLEFRPGNAAIVHHTVIMLDRSASSRDRDRQDDQPGFAGMFATNAEHPSGHFIGWTPGNLPEFLPAAEGWPLDPGTDLVLQTHFQSTGKQEAFQPSVGLFLADRRPTRVAQLIRLGRRNLDIPAGKTDYTMTDEYSLPVTVQLRGVYPHAHYLCTSMRAWADGPDGKTTSLLDIPSWDFNWQDDYRYQTPITLPQGSTISIRYTYDNSAANPRNPHHPPQRVVIGPNTTDEMGDLLLRVFTSSPADRQTLASDLRAKEAREELACYQTLTAARPDDPDNHNELALRFRNLGRVNQALHHFRLAIKLDRDYVAAHTNLGALYGSHGKFPDAERHLHRALQIDRQNPTAYNNLGTVFLRQHRLKEAIAAFQSALELSPDYAMAHYNLGLAFAAETQFQNSVSHLREAMRIRPEIPGVQQKLASVLRAMETSP